MYRIKKLSYRQVVGAVAITGLALGLSGCGTSSHDSSSTPSDKNTLVVAASPIPHAKILEFALPIAKKEGITLKIKRYSDYVLPNQTLQTGDVDANYFQHLPFLKQQIKDHHYTFEWGKGIHLEPLGLYSNKYKSLSEIKDGATIGIINDPSNQARGLRILNQAHLIHIPTDKDLSVADVVASPQYNPRHLKFKEVEGPQLVRSLDDVAAALINGNFAVEAGKLPKDALVLESAKNNPYSNILVWKKGTPKIAAIKKLDKILHSKAVQKFIERTWPSKAVVPAEDE